MSTSTSLRVKMTMTALEVAFLATWFTTSRALFTVKKGPGQAGPADEDDSDNEDINDDEDDKGNKTKTTKATKQRRPRLDKLEKKIRQRSTKSLPEECARGQPGAGAA